MLMLAALAAAQGSEIIESRDCAGCATMIAIPGGSFVMGSPKDEPNHGDAESPQHRVTVAAFAIGATDVTRGAFAAFVAATGYDTHDAKCDWRAPKAHGVPMNQTDNDPVVCVSWNDAVAYVDWLSKKSGQHYRLPSEAEWEYAARAGSSAARPWGAELTRDKANYGADPCCGAFAEGADKWLYTSPVGSFPANRFGLSDVIGDVWQWVADCGHDNYNGAPTDGSIWAGGDCSTHTVRGGAWFQGPESARSAARAADKTDFHIGDIGFRVAKSL